MVHFRDGVRTASAKGPSPCLPRSSLPAVFNLRLPRPQISLLGWAAMKRCVGMYRAKSAGYPHSLTPGFVSMNEGSCQHQQGVAPGGHLASAPTRLPDSLHMKMTDAELYKATIIPSTLHLTTLKAPKHEARIQRPRNLTSPRRGMNAEHVPTKPPDPIRKRREQMTSK